MDPFAPPEGVGWTAISTVSQRALESTSEDPLYRDPLALAVMDALPEDARRELEAHNEKERDGSLAFLRGYVSIRTQYFDRALLAACDAGVRQFVTLGAGLDGRAYRLQWPPQASVFELDGASVIAYKREVAKRAGILALARAVPVAADLREGWVTSLQAAGFDLDTPTAWLAEGLLNYLPTEAADRLLADLAALSHPGSRLIASYLDAAAERALAEVARRSKDASAERTAALRNQGPAADPARWLVGSGFEPEVTTVAEHAGRLRRAVPPALDPGSAGGTCWLFTAERPARNQGSARAARF